MVHGTLYRGATMSSHGHNRIRITVICALPEEVWERELTVSRGTTVSEAVEYSGFSSFSLKLDGKKLTYGIFGEIVDEQKMLEDGDRVEVYRPILADPKVVRRDLAREGKTMGKTGGGAKRDAS
jgi:putative ubiquitin-RnfH superfamily antitoxin RatB of RatAB toxin-antitoxin module